MPCRVYCTNRAYYAASVLGGLQHADQRITEDVERFSSCLAELHSYTFKPLLDVILFTHSLSSIMGYRSQLALYGYYIATAALTRVTSPPLAQMTAAEAALSGTFRSAHQVCLEGNGGKYGRMGLGLVYVRSLDGDITQRCFTDVLRRPAGCTMRL